MTAQKQTIAVIGGGVMGTVLLHALVDANVSNRIIVCDRDASKRKKLTRIGKAIRTTADISDCESANVLFLAVKPQDFSRVSLNLNKSTLVCSIMAGVPISAIRKQLDVKKVVRMMPNIPAKVKKGFTVWTASKQVTGVEKGLVKKVFACMGDDMLVKNERDIDKATAVTGSGPAYFFNTINAFIRAASRLGFSQRESSRMVGVTFKGVSALIDENTDLYELIKQVASKGGTTEAALRVFKKAELEDTWEQSVKAAYRCTQELSKAQTKYHI